MPNLYVALALSSNKWETINKKEAKAKQVKHYTYSLVTLRVVQVNKYYYVMKMSLH